MKFVNNMSYQNGFQKFFSLEKLGKGIVLLSGMGMASINAQAAGKIELSDTSWVSVGAGVRVAGIYSDEGAPDGDSSLDFDTQNIRLYVNGQVAENIGFTFNTDEIFADGPVDVLDAFVSFSVNEQVNFHIGRHLVPADRIEMNGPFYGLTWNQYTQPLYASDQVDVAGTYGRDDGATFWGKTGKFQYAIGIFEGLSGDGTANQGDSPLMAARFAYNFLNMEDNPAYYTSSTYFGGLGDIFTVALSLQSQSDGVGTEESPGDFSGYTVDVLYEKALSSGQALTVEAEYKSFDSDYEGGSPSDPTNFGLFDGESYFLSGAYLLPGDGMGRFQPYLRYVENSPSNFDSSTLTEAGLNYIIKGHNAKVNLNFASGDANISGYKGQDTNSISVGFQLQI
ncbi:porin [Marinibactrum halimedae]|uniref:Short chain amide porin n=1 Tax=Marinibactrum halimedae TaxID=1444977 RepID=A0AA37TCI2_9GAMM|nr:porin [Marinibactrum halimedae]MCD9460839.1 OprO/OprP family phosphate-selective porin [Marinibactrum halimedae]GLS26697.1 hypothetical protein GCM10007877_24140 [Marinibactrum halimedae]